MNIKEAKQEIKNSVRAYLTKDGTGKYRIPVKRQRPLFLIGPPGTGKTAIVEQVSEELGLALVVYSMTHHTRQSAVGLPYICEESFGGESFRVSRYTMSEIIATVYEVMKKTGFSEGILFLDEINCVSETLAPSLLQFLQFKTFGQHSMPEGWVIVTAGNPPEFNDSVREFDMATTDRLKTLEIEADYSVWHEWALSEHVHPCVTGYLELHREELYYLEAGEKGPEFATPRSWTDLSDMIYLYEENEIPVSRAMAGEYLRCGKIASRFSEYCMLWNKYREFYRPDEILDGHISDGITAAAEAAAFDERLSLINLLIDALMPDIKSANQAYEEDKAAEGKTGSKKSAEDKSRIKTGSTAEDRTGSCPDKDGRNGCGNDKTGGGSACYASKAVSRLENAFNFINRVFGGDSAEMSAFTANITASSDAALFIGRFGCNAYFAYSRRLLFYERQMDIRKRLNET